MSAAIDVYVTNNVSAKKCDTDVPARCGGSTKKVIMFNFEKGTETDLSVWRVGTIPGRAKVLSIKLSCDAISSLTELDIGLYEQGEGGVVIDRDCFKDALNPAAGLTTLTEEYAPALANVGKDALAIASIAEADKYKYASVDVCLVGVTAGTDAGTISGTIEYID